jgi:hypothetical protein
MELSVVRIRVSTMLQQKLDESSILGFTGDVENRGIFCMFFMETVVVGFCDSLSVW